MTIAAPETAVLDEVHVGQARRDPDPSQAPAESAIRSELERILASQTFIRSRRLGRFLRFTIEQALEGHQAALKEYLVGVEVFNKSESFDPRIDSIVRVEARRLRSKLERYYQTEGKDDPIIIHFSKGSYVPTILNREDVAALELLRRNGVAQTTRTVAVQGLTQIGADTEDQAFASGLSEDLISALTKIESLQVKARGGDAKPDFVIEGSVRKAAGKLRVSIQLIDMATGFYLWSDTYERSQDEAFALQEEIARATADVVRAHVS